VTKLHVIRVTLSPRERKNFCGPGAFNIKIDVKSSWATSIFNFLKKKKIPYPNNIARKKLICVETMAELPRMTVPYRGPLKNQILWEAHPYSMGFGRRHSVEWALDSNTWRILSQI
jgi:hypothetical protein